MSPRIVILDGATLNPGDLDWQPLRALGTLEVHERTCPADVLARAAGAQILLTNKVLLNAATLAALPHLQAIGVLATGFNVVDTVAARARGIPVSNVPGYGTASVAQHVWALILELCNRVGDHTAAVRSGAWTVCPDFCFTLQPLVELSGLTLGIIGYGAIGQAVAAVGRAFGMNVIIHSRTPQPGLVTLEELLHQSDIISLHCPLTEATHGLINAERLAIMKRTALLINTSRGPLIDEPALAAALTQGTIAGAALDVLSLEPPHAANPLLAAPHCLITPHLAWATRAARQRLLDAVVTNVQAFINGAPIHVVNA